MLGQYRDIFLGHTPTKQYNSLLPVHFCNVWEIDTGAGWGGKLTIMEVDSKEFWQSDMISDLYSGIN
jgi:serine/threonine protein phosphatase 1